MSKAIDNIYLVINNPIVLKDIIIEFYKCYKNRERDILIAYLILPLVLNEDSRRKLKNLNKKSNLISLTRDADSIVGLEFLIEEYKEITNKCIQLALSEGYLQLDSDYSLKFVENADYVSQNVQKEELRAIKRLSMLIEPYEIVEVYRMLGVKTI